jgi:hypothetical protein
MGKVMDWRIKRRFEEGRKVIRGRQGLEGDMVIEACQGCQYQGLLTGRQ